MFIQNTQKYERYLVFWIKLATKLGKSIPEPASDLAWDILRSDPQHFAFWWLDLQMPGWWHTRFLSMVPLEARPGSRSANCDSDAQFFIRCFCTQNLYKRINPGVASASWRHFKNWQGSNSSCFMSNVLFWKFSSVQCDYFSTKPTKPSLGLYYYFSSRCLCLVFIFDLFDPNGSFSPSTIFLL